MNNKGWGLNELLIGLGIIGFALILSTLLFQAKFKEINEMLEKGQKKEETSNIIIYTYEDMETELVMAATKYMEKKNAQSSVKGSEKITMDTLVKEKLYTSQYDPKDKNKKCEGYVIFNKKGSSVSYTPYLNCEGNYQTKGYK